MTATMNVTTANVPAVRADFDERDGTERFLVDLVVDGVHFVYAQTFPDRWPAERLAARVAAAPALSLEHMRTRGCWTEVTEAAAPAKTAEDFEEEAARCWQRREESYERSGADGFLSQWASGVSAQLATMKADLLKAGRRSEFTGLYQGPRRVATRQIPTKYGTAWLLRDDEAARFGRKFVPVGKTSSIQKELGLSERREMAPAWAKIEGSGSGMSGQAWAVAFRTGDRWGLDAVLVVPADAAAPVQLTDGLF